MYTLISLSLLVMAASGRLTNDEWTTRTRIQNKSRDTVQPLLRFPFIYSLANPCDFQSDMFESEESHESFSSLRDLDGNGEIPLAQQALDFLTPFRDLIDVQSVHDPNNLNDTNLEEEQSVLTQEFKLVVSQALLLIGHIYSPAVLEECNNFRLKSLSRNIFLVVSSTGEIQFGKLYRSLLVIAAHLHAIMDDIYDSNKLCSSESMAHLQIIRQLIGKVKTSMCLILHFTVVPKHEKNEDFFGITHEVLQSTIYRYYFCSARKIRECLVMNYTHETFKFVQRFFEQSTEIVRHQ